MFAVVRLVHDLEDRWHVLRASRPLHSRDVVDVAGRIGAEYHLDPRLVAAIYDYPRLPIDRVYAFWCAPDKLLDIRPIDHTTVVRHLRLDRDGEIEVQDQECEVGRFEALRDTPLGAVEELEPYGTERRYRSRTDR